MSAGGKLPVLTYHGLHRSDLPRPIAQDAFYSVTAEKFEWQMSWLRARAFREVLVSEFERESSQLENKVCITFDDGLKSDFEVALPILRLYGLRATFFVTVDRIGHEDYVSWNNLEQMLAAGNSVQCHGLHHEDLTRVQESTLLNDLALARKALSSRLGTEVHSLALPFGCCNDKVARVAMQAGFERIFNSEQRLARVADRLLPRFVIHSRTADRHFRQIVSGQSLSLCAASAKQGSIAMAKRLLGQERYLTIKRKLFL